MALPDRDPSIAANTSSLSQQQQGTLGPLSATGLESHPTPSGDRQGTSAPKSSRADQIIKQPAASRIRLEERVHDVFLWTAALLREVMNVPADDELAAMVKAASFR